MNFLIICIVALVIAFIILKIAAAILSGFFGILFVACVFVALWYLYERKHNHK